MATKKSQGVSARSAGSLNLAQMFLYSGIASSEESSLFNTVSSHSSSSHTLDGYLIVGNIDSNRSSMSSLSGEMTTISGEGSRLDVIVSSIRDIRARKAVASPKKQYGPKYNSRQGESFNASFGDLFDVAYGDMKEAKELPRIDCEQNLSISDHTDRMSKIRLRQGNPDKRATQEDQLPTKASQTVPSIQCETLTMTLQNALTICNDVMLDPGFDNIEGRKSSGGVSEDCRRQLKDHVETSLNARRHRSMQSFDGLRRPCRQRSSKRWQRTRSGTLDLYTPSRHSRPTLEGDLITRSSKHSTHSIFSDISFDDDSSISSFNESEVSSLGMGSMDAPLDLGGWLEESSRKRRTSRRRSQCPSVDTVLHGNASATISREDSSPKRPSRRRSRSPKARRSLSSLEVANRFATHASRTPHDSPPCHVVRQISSTGNLELLCENGKM
jgi:hypothetical protein